MITSPIKSAWYELLPVRTLGQQIYIVVMSNPDGVGADELIERLQEQQPTLDGGKVLIEAASLTAKGVIRLDGNRWYAPGPTNAIWEML
jgi:hypothetical protein